LPAPKGHEPVLVGGVVAAGYFVIWHRKSATNDLFTGGLSGAGGGG
jgi:hypothetical protein